MAIVAANTQKKEDKTRFSIFIKSLLFSFLLSLLFLSAAFLKNHYFSGSYTEIDIIGGVVFVFFLSFVILLVLIPKIQEKIGNHF
ncbi:hypothetical protein MsAm2_00400 [Methanolapillus ohkumae]|uniref:Uncharacterized protein n=1 Tax=Methanolapillus ohkumae TaxID=3028298 RepID=A0AA96V6A1_9EURY|nr:hypothetical protein MsAm2_00400 [Methanosarcinaceae archaeon Am2]